MNSTSSPAARPRRFLAIDLAIILTGFTAIAVGGHQTLQNEESRRLRADAAEVLKHLEFTHLRRIARQGAPLAGPVDLATYSAPPALRGVYHFELVAAAQGKSGDNAARYLVRAVPDANGPLARDRCGALQVDETGHRSITGSRSVAECWRS